ncbi:MAG: hypothetical protein HYW07_09420 [Candidatus Latescibacteria bacterium]|nr:hypothetical protein [Candidatus Latescibacterota bacterium]
MKVSVFIAASLDGYIARSDGGLTIQAFLDAGLLTDLTLTRTPWPRSATLSRF